MAFVGRALVRDREAVGDALGGASPGWVVTGIALAAAGMVAIALPWSIGLRLLGSRVERLRHLPWYFVGEIGKYVPGGVWPVLGRGEMARRRGVAPRAAYASVALSLVALYLAATAVAVGLFPFRVADGGATWWWIGAAVLLPLGLVALHPRAVGGGVRFVERLTGRDLRVEAPSWGDSLRYVASYLPAWGLICLATWAVARAFTPDAPLGGIAFAAVLSWLAGFLAVPVPGGVGVREAVFVATAGLDPGVGAAVAVVARVVFMAIDVVGALAGTAWVARHDRVGAGTGAGNPSGSLRAEASDEDRAPGRRRGR